MNCIVIDYDQAKLERSPKAIPTGQSGFSKLKFKFSEEWAGMTKIAQFAQEKSRYNVSIENDECYCPIELTKGWVFVRVRGYSESSTIATANEIKLPVVNGFVPGGSPSVPPEPDLYQKLIKETKGQIGDLNDLRTEDKSSLVGAVNEVKTQAEIGGDAVKYIKQELTDAQKQQARENIGGVRPVASITYSFTGRGFTCNYTATQIQSLQTTHILMVDSSIASVLTCAGKERVSWVKGKTMKYMDVDDAGQIAEIYMVPLDDKSLGLSDVKVGQLAKIDAVDASGVPTVWSTLGVVTPEKLLLPDSTTDLVNYEAFQAAVPMVQQMGIAGATVGQLLRVKAIHNGGYPTKWGVINVSVIVSNSSTNDELATAKAVYDAITSAIGNIDTLVGTGEVTT